MSAQPHLAEKGSRSKAIRLALPWQDVGRLGQACCISLILIICCIHSARSEPAAPTSSPPVPVSAIAATGSSLGAVPGWSFSNSSDPDSRQYIQIEENKPEVVFLFDRDNSSDFRDSEYRYRLVGHDVDWQNTRFRVAHYRQLVPGKYLFEVQKRRSGGQWLSRAISVSIGEQAPIYRTWSFYFVLPILTVAIPMYLYRRRVQLMKGRIGIVLEERNRIARECHDTLMAGFAAISWQLEATAKLFRDGDLAATPAAQSCELARSMVSHCQAEARRIIWDLRDTDEVTDMLSEALSRTLAATHLRESIDTSLDIEGDEIPLAPGCIHHLLCIGQEAITNAIRHADPTRITIHLKYEAESLTLSIQDDGRGFHPSDRTASRHGHFGIPVMEERARKLGGTLRVQTLIGSGTEVTARVSFNALQQPANQEHHVIRWIGI